MTTYLQQTGGKSYIKFETSWILCTLSNKLPRPGTVLPTGFAAKDSELQLKKTLRICNFQCVPSLWCCEEWTDCCQQLWWCAVIENDPAQHIEQSVICMLTISGMYQRQTGWGQSSNSIILNSCGSHKAGEQPHIPCSWKYQLVSYNTLMRSQTR